jgi:hypothetical protein
MPRIIVTKDFPPQKHAALVKKLATELASSGDEVQPLILEEHVMATNSRHVHVVWDRWKDIPDEERAAIIVEAYRQADLEDAASEITIAAGVTPEEAVLLGVLPWKVVPARKKNGKLSEADYKKALASEARHTVFGSKARELRYARMEDANEAADRLGKALPGSSWAVVHEVLAES